MHVYGLIKVGIFTAVGSSSASVCSRHSEHTHAVNRSSVKHDAIRDTGRLQSAARAASRQPHMLSS